MIAFAWAQTPADLSTEWRRNHLVKIEPSNLRHADVKRYLQQLRESGVRTTEVGRSVGGKDINQLEFGRGPFKVFLWSQMHGDEPTATAALLDVFNFLHQNRSKRWVESVEQKMTIRAVPMLNPDGSDLYLRRNFQSIDINRDARALVTPEGRLLKQLRDEWKPDLGFNLHNQNARTAVGNTGKQATIALLAVPFDATGKDNTGRILAKRVSTVIYNVLSPLIPGQISRYDDSFNPRAFGDLISAWGTPVVLIETGGWYGKTEGDLVELNFIALLSVFRSLADGNIDKANPSTYDSLLYNESGAIYDLIVRNATVVNRMQIESGKMVEPFRADVSVNLESQRRPSERTGSGQIQEVGDLSSVRGLEMINASGYFVTVAEGVLRQGTEAVLLFYRESRAREIAWDARDLETRFPPDAIYRGGRWSGRDTLPRKEMSSER
jgi:Zinc carboxypeptidase